MFETGDRGRQAGSSEQEESAFNAAEYLMPRGGLSHKTDNPLEPAVGKANKTNDNMLGIDIAKDAKQIAELLNEGKSDQAVNLLSKDLSKLSGEAFNQLLLQIRDNEDPEIDGDTNGHLLLSDWNTTTKTWEQVFVAERDQLYRIVQPGNTLKGIAADRLGPSASQDAISRYAKNISDVNGLPAPELIIRGQALRLPYPH